MPKKQPKLIDLIVHPLQVVTFQGVERRGGERVQATEVEELAYTGKLLTPDEFERVCIDLNAAAEFNRQQAAEKQQASLEALRSGAEPEEPEETEEPGQPADQGE